LAVAYGSRRIFSSKGPVGVPVPGRLELGEGFVQDKAAIPRCDQGPVGVPGRERKPPYVRGKIGIRVSNKICSISIVSR
jgi:hypothetical protein